MLIRAINPSHQAILQASANGDLEFLKTRTLAELYASKCLSGCTALHWAAGMNQVHVIQYLLCLSQTHEISSSYLNLAATTTIHEFHVDIAIARKFKAAGRTPLHYAARNGCLEAAQCLVEEFHANPNATAKHGVTPLHLCFFQNQKKLAKYLLSTSRHSRIIDAKELKNNIIVDLFQTNDYGCNVLHWLAICPVSRSGPNGGEHLVPTAQWLNEMQQQTWCDRTRSVHHDETEKNDDLCREIPRDMDLFHAVQTQGHTVLHKAAWLGHYTLIQYLHERHDIWDDRPDHSGNFAVTLAEMANHSDDGRTVNYLRTYCSRSAAYSCSILGLDDLNDANNPSLLRRAYHRMALKYHPDRQQQWRALFSKNDKEPGVRSHLDGTEKDDAAVTFDAICRAYYHLSVEKGRGMQCNPAHQLQLLLPSSHEMNDTNDPSFKCIRNGDFPDDDCFKARLIVVLKEYGNKGLDISNLKKKWRQVWRMDFPDTGSVSLTQWIQHYAGDVVDVLVVNQCRRAYVRTQ